ncbi:TonB-dependent receptor plug domain-containing protein [Novosphingobium panipatense]|uniref:TonB-dependent receptor plug domain-containing protein n=1 Tax=Novosphingobium panipatense TaxID=428991 RepID=UPI00360A6421
MPSSRSRHSRPAVRPAYLALACVGFAASPVAAQDKAEDQTPSLGGVTVSDTVIEEQPYKVDRADSPKYTAPLLDTPKSIVVLPSEVIRESGSTSFVEALRMVPGITFGAGEGATRRATAPSSAASTHKAAPSSTGSAVSADSRERFSRLNRLRS